MTTAHLATSPVSIRFEGASIFGALARTGLLVGTLDALDGVAYFGITAGLDPIRVLQFIASGALGPRAFDGGLLTAALGGAFHFAIAYVAVATYLVAYTRSALVARLGVLGGASFGVAVWAVMNLMVVPASAIGAFPTVGGAIHGILGHALTVGVASAWGARRWLAAR